MDRAGRGPQALSAPLTALIAATAAAALLFLPSTSRAEEIPQVTSFTASPSTVKVGTSTIVSASIAPLNSSYSVVIVDTDTGYNVTRCAATFSPCKKTVGIPWSENLEPKDRHFEAEVVPKEQPPTGSGVPLTVHVERTEWSISLLASKNPMTIGELTKLSVKGLEPNPEPSGYHTTIVNDTTGEIIKTCSRAECWREIGMPYSMEAEPGPVQLHAEVVSETAPYDVAGRADLTLWVDPIRFSVSMYFTEPYTANGGTSWLAIQSATPQLASSPFTVAIEQSTGKFVSSCALWVTCEHRLVAGTYRAVVKDSENIYASTQWWTIPQGSSAPPEEESADDFNLLSLAAMFTGPSEVCTDLLFYPGTHFEGGSVSDQYLDCEGAVAEGKSTAAVLRAAAAAGGGTAVLWYLYEEKTKEQTPEEDTEPAEEAEPPPGPPVGWPGEIEAEAAILRELNPQLESDREARTVIKQCQRLTTRAALPTGDCTEMPIFGSGDLDVPQATKHDLEALMYYPGWVKLNYENAEGKPNREWYNAFSVCDESPRIRNCDEFPFFSTEQGGGNARPRPSLKLIDAKQNKRQGGKLSRFYIACGVNMGQGKSFLNIPMPPGSNVSTLILCNGSS